MGKGEVYPKEANTLYLIDIIIVIDYSLFLLLARRACGGTGAIQDVLYSTFFPHFSVLFFDILMLGQYS
jgi:hypothetical protein